MNVSNPYQGKKMWLKLSFYLGITLVFYLFLTWALQGLITRYYQQDTAEKADLIGRYFETELALDTLRQSVFDQTARDTMHAIGAAILAEPASVSDAFLRHAADTYTLKEWYWADLSTGEIMAASAVEWVGEQVVAENAVAAFLFDETGERQYIEPFVQGAIGDPYARKAHFVTHHDFLLTVVRTFEYGPMMMPDSIQSMLDHVLDDEQVIAIEWVFFTQQISCEGHATCRAIELAEWPMFTAAQTLIDEGREAETFVEEDRFVVLNRFDVEGDTVGFLTVAFTKAIMNPSLRMLYVTAGGVMTLMMLVTITTVVYGSSIQARSYERSLTDPVTGAYNRTAWTIHTEKETKLSMIRVSLMGFDNLVTLYGDDFRETVLRLLAARLRTHVPHVRLYRLDGDHFVLATMTHQAPLLGQLADQVANLIYDDLMYGAMTLNLRCKCGLLVSTERPDSVNTTMRALGMALQAAERDPKRIYYFYDDALHQTATRDDAIYKTLHQTLLNEMGQSLHVVFQPQYAVDDPRIITGIEVLSRLKVEGFGWISPTEFIPIAEKRGLIGRLGHFILHETGRHYVIFTNQFSSVPPLSINASVIELTQETYAKQVIDVLKIYEMPANALFVEVTETAFSQNREALMRSLQALKAAGIRIALDDFGAGYSSLAYLSLLNIDLIKIDRQFINSIGQEALALQVIKSVVDMARSIGADVLAEGIETKQQLERVKAMGVRYVQGFFFQKPIDQTILMTRLKAMKGLK